MNNKLLAIILTTAITSSVTTGAIIDMNTPKQVHQPTQPKVQQVDQYELDVRECMIQGMSLAPESMTDSQLKSALPTMEVIAGQSVKDYVNQYGDLLGRSGAVRDKCESLILLRDEAKRYLSEHK